MSEAITEKARNLIRLRDLGFRTPAFLVVTARGDLPDLRSLGRSAVILRGCTLEEDQVRSSGAGQGTSVGPVDISRVPECFPQLGADRRIREIVIQQFVDAPTGVLLCADSQRALLEFSRIREGVTAGLTLPFTAVFPNEIPRYREVARLVGELFSHFGPCNAELALAEPVSLLQVRPLSRDAVFDESSARSKMQLQELPFARLIQDEFCLDLAESPLVEAALVDAYCTCRKELFAELGIQEPELTRAQFVKVGHQVFVESDAQAPGDGVELGAKRSFSLAQWSAENLLSLWWSRRRDDLGARELMRCAVSLRTLAEFVDRLPSMLRRRAVLRVLAARDECRQRLAAILPSGALPAVASCERPLRGPLAKDDERMLWRSIEMEDADGQVVVDGDFESGPYRVWSAEMVFPGERVILLCDRLDPAIFPRFAQLKGIICESGGLTSHLAILAREFDMPLRIQVAGAIARYPSPPSSSGPLA